MPQKPWLKPLAVHKISAKGWPRLGRETQVLFRQLEKQIERSVSASIFDVDDDGPATLWKHSDAIKKHVDGIELFVSERRDQDLPGIYVFVATDKRKLRPFYVGITRSLCKRLRQHLRGKTHNTATLLHAMLCNEPISGAQQPKQRKDTSMTNLRARRMRSWLRSQRVALLPISCPVQRYVLELYASIRFQTGHLNAFETH